MDDYTHMVKEVNPYRYREYIIHLTYNIKLDDSSYEGPHMFYPDTQIKFLEVDYENSQVKVQFYHPLHADQKSTIGYISPLFPFLVSNYYEGGQFEILFDAIRRDETVQVPIVTEGKLEQWRSGAGPRTTTIPVVPAVEHTEKVSEWKRAAQVTAGGSQPPPPSWETSPSAGGGGAAGGLEPMMADSGGGSVESRLGLQSGIGDEYATLIEGTLQKQKKTVSALNWIPRWGNREARLYMIKGTNNYYLSWSSGNDPRGVTNIIMFHRVEEIKLKEEGSGACQFHIIMKLNEIGEKKEYWFRIEGAKAQGWVGAIAYVSDQIATQSDYDPPTLTQEPPCRGISFAFALNREKGKIQALLQQQQGGRRTKKRTKKRKPRTKKRTKKRTNKRTNKKKRKKRKIK